MRKPDQQRLDQAEQAFKLVTEGHSYRSAGAIMGVSHETVRNRVTEYADRLVLPLAEEWRKREVEQLTYMLDRLQAKIEAGNEAAIATAIRVMERKHKLLGLDAPVQVQHTVVEVTQADLEFAEVAREAAFKAAQSPVERLLQQGGGAGGR